MAAIVFILLFDNKIKPKLNKFFYKKKIIIRLLCLYFQINIITLHVLRKIFSA
jgi:hypothetical protein